MTQEIASQLSKDPTERQRQIDYLRRHSDLEAHADQLKQIADAAALEVTQLEVKELGQLIETDTRAELEGRLAKQAQEDERRDEENERDRFVDKVLRKEEDIEEKARRRREQAAVDDRKVQVVEQLKRLRGLKVARIIDRADARKLDALEALATKHGW